MKNITEREKLNKILAELCDDYLHMVLVAAETLHSIQNKSTT